MWKLINIFPSFVLVFFFLAFHRALLLGWKPPIYLCLRFSFLFLLGKTKINNRRFYRFGLTRDTCRRLNGTSLCGHDL
jgi:hypothetical protein